MPQNTVLDEAAREVADASNNEITQKEARAELDAEIADGTLEAPPTDDINDGSWPDPDHVLYPQMIQDILNRCCDKKGCDRIVLPLDEAQGDPLAALMSALSAFGADDVGDEADDLND